MAQGWDAVRGVLDRAAVLLAFEQIGGASACLDMATGYAKERHAFGRPIGGFQAIKHKLADVYIATELARSNAYYGAWAVSAGGAELPLAAATARVSASEAFFLAAKENIQVHGGIGFTWEMDCHLFYRRAKHLGAAAGQRAALEGPDGQRTGTAQCGVTRRPVGHARASARGRPCYRNPMRRGRA